MIVALLASCAKERDCKIGGLNIGFNTLNPTENDTIWIRSYEKGSGFATLVNESEYIFYSNEDSINGITNGTTLELKGNYGNLFCEADYDPGYLNSGYDYEVQLRSTIYQIKKMDIKVKTQKCGGLLSLDCPSCYSPVTKFWVSNNEKSVASSQVYFLD